MMQSKRTTNLLGAVAQLVVDGQLNALETASDLNPVELAGLITIRNEPEQQIDFLHKTLRRSHSATVRMIAKLTSMGLVAKGQGAQDARGVALTITQQGEDVITEVLKSRETALSALLAFLNKEERNQLDSLLAKLLAATVVDELNAYQICRFCDADACDVCPVEESFS